MKSDPSMPVVFPALFIVATLSTQLIAAQDPPGTASPPGEPANQAPGPQEKAASVPTGRKVVVTASGLQEEALETPYSFELVDERELLEGGYRTLPEALRDLPGVMVQKTAHGHGSPYIRGFTGRQNLVLIDGIRFNNAAFRGGPVQYSNLIDSLSIGRFELIKSQGSVLYGSDAIGGTLNVFTKSADFRHEAPGEFFDHGMALYRFATNGASHTGRFETQLGEGDAFGLHVGLTYRDFGDIRDSAVGTMPKTGYEEFDYDLRFDQATSERTTLTLAHQRLEQDDIWRTHRTIHFEPWHGTSLDSPDLARIYDQERTLSYLRWAGERMESWVDNFALTFSHQRSVEDFNRTRPRSGDIEVQLDDTTVDTFGAALALDKRIGPGHLVWGVDYYRDEIDSHTRVSRYDAGGALVSETMAVQGPIGDDARYDLMGVYGQYVWEATDALDVTLGGRYTYARADIGRLDDGSGNPTSAERDWDQATFNLRASYRMTERWQVFGGASEAFRAPNVDDLSSLKSSRSDLISTGSLAVEPESYLTYELGTRFRDDDLVAHASVFYTDIDDVITSRPIGTDPMTGEVITTTTNGSAGHLWGAEASASWRFEPQWTLSGYVAYVDGEADTYPTNSLVPVREPISRLMPLTASVALRWDEAFGKVWVEGRVTAADRADRLGAGDRGDTSRIPPGGTPGYYVVQIDSGYQANSNLEFFLTLENVMDTAYRIHGSGLNQPGFNAILGARLIW